MTSQSTKYIKFHKVNEDNVMLINDSGYGVDDGFNSITENSLRFNVIPGQLNKLSIKPRIGNEHCESSRTIQSTVTATNLVNQHFKSSKDNITALSFTGESASGALVDDFETYNNSTELQASWVATGNLALLETTIIKNGTKSMALPGDILNNKWVKTVTSMDYTGYTGSFNANFSKDFGKFKVSVFIEDIVGNSKSFQLVFTNKDTWVHYDILESTMIEDILNTLPTDTTQIIKVGFNIDLQNGGEFAFIDDIIATPPGGKLGVKLWDMGLTEPTDGVTKISDGTQYDKLNGSFTEIVIDLKGGKRLYHLHNSFNAGTKKNDPLNNKLINIGHYYLVEFYYIDTDVALYGPDPAFLTDYYTDGYASTALNEITPITKIGPYSDLMFVIQSMQNVYIKEVEWKFDTPPIADSDLFVFIEDTGMLITDVVTDHEEIPEQQKQIDVSSRPMFMEDGGKLEFYYNSDLQTNSIVISMTYFYEK